MALALVLGMTGPGWTQVRAQEGFPGAGDKSYRLVVGGLVKNPLSLSLGDIHKLPSCGLAETGFLQDSQKTAYQGVLLRDLLLTAGIKPEGDKVALFGMDGYSAVLPLEYVMEGRVLLAHSKDAKPLSPAEGFPIKAVPDDMMGYKWVEMGWIKKVLIIKTGQ